MEDTHPDKHQEGQVHPALLPEIRRAQDVEEVFPELVTTDSNGNKAVYYGQMVAVLLEAMKEQQTEITELKKQQATIAELTEKIAQLEKELGQK